MGHRVAGIAVGAAEGGRHPVLGHAEDEQQLLEIGPMVLGEAVDDGRGAAAPQLTAIGRAVLAAEGNRGGVVVQPVKANPKALAHRHHHLGQQCRPVSIKQPVEGAADAIVGQSRHRSRADPEQSGGEAIHGLLLAVDRFPLDDDRAQQHPQGLRLRDRIAPVGGGNVLVKNRLQAHALEEGIDQRQRSQALAVQGEAGIWRKRGLRTVHVVVIINDNTAPVNSQVHARTPPRDHRQASTSAHHPHPGGARSDRLPVFRHAARADQDVRPAELRVRAGPGSAARTVL